MNKKTEILELECELNKALFHQWLFIGLAAIVGLIKCCFQDTYPSIQTSLYYPILIFCVFAIASGVVYFLAKIKYVKMLNSTDDMDDDPQIPEGLPKVLGWTKYNDNQKRWKEKDDNSGGYLAVMNEVRRMGFKFGGNYHQYGAYGCPVMEDGSVLMMSQRSWGGLMAEVWGGMYTDYAWSDDMGKVPTEKDHADAINKDQADIEEEERIAAEAKAKLDAYQKQRDEEQDQQDKANTKAAKSYISALKKKYKEADAAELVKFLETELLGILARANDTCHGHDYKWVLFEEERKRVEKEAKKRRKQALEKLKDLVAPLESNDSSEDKDQI